MFLSGERSGRYGIGELDLALDFFTHEKKSGYVRITEEHDGLLDYYLIFLDGEEVGALMEEEKSKEYGKIARESFMGEHMGGIVETYLVPKKSIEIFFENMPHAFFVELKKKKEPSPPKKSSSFKIAGAEIKPLSAIRTEMPTEKLTFSQLRKELEEIVGCVRLVCEMETVLEEGCIVSGNGTTLVFYENEETLYGEKALVRIMLMLGKRGVADLFALDGNQIDELASIFSASRVKGMGSPEKSEEYRVEKARREATNLLGIRLGRLILESPFTGTFSLEISMRTAEEKNFSGYLWLEMVPHFGLLYLEGGEMKACLHRNKTLSFGREAFEKVFSFSGEGRLKFYETPHTTIKEKKALFQMSKEEETDMLIRRVASEMGKDMITEIKGAQKFKRMFIEKRESEADEVS